MAVRTSKDGKTIIGDSWIEMGVDVNELRGQQKTFCPNCRESRSNRADKSLSVNTSGGVASCHYCGIHYVLNDHKGDISRIASVKEYTLPVQSIRYEIDEKVAEWFAGRGISLETLKKMKVTSDIAFMPQRNKKVDTINFNYFFDDTLVNIKYRDGAKNFKMESGAKLIFYNQDVLLDRELQEVVIVEGEMDALSLIESSVPNVISVPNGASKGSPNLDYLTNSYELFDTAWRQSNGYLPLSKIVIATDNDEAGLALKAELVRRLGDYRCYEVDFGEHKDANELLMARDKVAVFNAIDMAKRIPIKDITEADDLLEDILQMRAEGGLKPGAQVGDEEFKELVSFEMARLTTIIGIPSHGKTEFLDDLMCRLAVQHDWVFALFSPESFPIKAHATRLMSKLVGKWFNNMSEAEIRYSLDFIQNHFVWIYPEDDDYTLRNILSIARSAVKRYGINALVIDPWTEVDKEGETDTDGVNKHLSNINQFKRKENLHVFLVVHPTKQQKDPDTHKYTVPDLYDASGSANFFNKSDMGISIHRNFEADTTDVFINKMKFAHLGRVGMCTMKYNRGNGRFQGLADISRNKYDDSNWLKPKDTQLSVAPF